MEPRMKFLIFYIPTVLGLALVLFIVGMSRGDSNKKGTVSQQETVVSEAEKSDKDKPAKVIMISDAEELQKIGTSKEYPMDGDYALDADIDLTGVDWEPIGGAVGIKGEISGANVFTGTFDGQGHVIYGLTIRKDGNIVPQTSYAKIGLFGVIASKEQEDYAEVKNLIFKDVNIKTDFSDGTATVGTLAGEVNGYAKIDNIAIMSGTLIVNPSGVCDTVGAGGLIGECRTENALIGNMNITITNVFNGADVEASGSRADLIYTGGIVGRIAKSGCKGISQCVNVGNIRYQGSSAYAIAGTEAGNVALLDNTRSCYYLEGSAMIFDYEAEAYTEEELKAGELCNGLSKEMWVAKQGDYVMPLICAPLVDKESEE